LAGIQELIEDAAMSLSADPGCPVAAISPEPMAMTIAKNAPSSREATRRRWPASRRSTVVRTSATKHTKNRLSSTSQVFPKRLWGKRATVARERLSLSR
jgi:hypothetical protein